MVWAFIVAALLDQKPLFGFNASSVQTELSWEARVDSSIDPRDQAQWMRTLTARPHHVGSAYGLINAEFMLKLYQSWGYDAQIERFYVLFPTPKTRLLEMGSWRAKLFEPTIPSDPTGKASSEALPLYNCYSIDGDVKGKLVYVNYGVPKDYDTLEAHGIDIKGKIVIARYGGSWRGIKPKVAAEHGAIGCIIYSDPRDDGYGQGDVYPKGGWRNEDGGQRGSVADMPIYPGDPLTPGYGATKDAKRIALKDAITLTKIPVLPISYGDAKPLIESLQGPMAPPDWRGGLPVPYHLGPSTTDVHLKVAFNWDTVEARDVIAKLPGSQYPDEWVIRGNHHDAWVYGAQDPISGQVAMLNEAKALGGLVKDGWRPKRTIVFCSWDGEEPGLLGSTEWLETHLDELTQKAVAYVNTDSNSRGFVGLEGAHSLERFLNEVVRDVQDPETKVSVLERAKARAAVNAAPAEKEAALTGDIKIGALGSGSDYSSFIQHAGIAAIDLGYGGEGDGSQYHSTYDSYDWVMRFSDPGLVYGGVLSETGARVVMRLADADELPFEFTHLAKTVEGYLKELSALEDSMRLETQEQNKLIEDGTLSKSFDPTKTNVAPKPKDVPPFLNLAPLQNAVARLAKAANALEVKRKSSAVPDSVLIATERALLGPGLPGRPWYRHTVVAPGLYTGYGVKTFPGVREAIEQRHWKEAEDQTVIAAAALDRLSSILEKASQ